MAKRAAKEILGESAAAAGTDARTIERVKDMASRLLDEKELADLKVSKRKKRH